MPRRAVAELGMKRTEPGRVAPLRLRWRSRLRGGLARRGANLAPRLATLSPPNWCSLLLWPLIDIARPVAGAPAHVRIRQRSTAARPSARPDRPTDAPERDRKAAAHGLRDLRLDRTLRGPSCGAPGARVDLAGRGPKGRHRRLSRGAGLPPRVEAVHFNALSGLIVGRHWR